MSLHLVEGFKHRGSLVVGSFQCNHHVIACRQRYRGR
jgi:hypothetical protein